MKTNENDALEAVKPQVRREKYDLRRNEFKHSAKCFSISLETIERITMNCMTWEEAKPHVDLLEKVFGMNPPQAVTISIKRIKKRFEKKVFGRTIKAKTVVMNNNSFEAMNKITKNKHVKL